MPGPTKAIKQPSVRTPRITIDDVAREAGVSKGTVSRVLNRRNWVSDSAREAVTDAMNRTGFVANAAARSLATRRTGNIALVLGAPATQLFDDPNYALILQVISEELANNDYSLVFMTAATFAERDRLARFLRAKYVDGVAFMSAGEPKADDLINLMLEQPIPVVIIGHPFPDGDPLPFVAADEVEGGKIMARHFVEQGYSRIGIVGTHLESRSARQRVDFFLKGVGTRSKKAWLVEADDYSIAAGRKAMRTLLSREDKLDAVFATSDMLAAGAISAALELGLRVPEDIAIAGFDDSPIASRTVPQLTTVRQDVAVVAREIVAHLLAAIDGRSSDSHIVPVELIVRDSA